MKFPLLCICSIVSYDSLSCCILHLQNYLLRGLEDIQKSWPVSIMFFFETSVSIMLNCMSLLLASPLYSVIRKIKKWIFIVFNFSGSTASHVCFGDKSTCVFLEKKKDKFEYSLTVARYSVPKRLDFTFDLLSFCIFNGIFCGVLSISLEADWIWTKRQFHLIEFLLQKINFRSAVFCFIRGKMSVSVPSVVHRNILLAKNHVLPRPTKMSQLY
jgi:hypothetical protein